MTKVKGSNIYLARRFSEQQAADAWPRILARLSEEDRGAAQSMIAAGWYEISLQHRVFTALDQTLPEIGPDTIASFARYVAEHDLTGIHRLFLKFRSPAYALEKCGEYWNRFYDAGKWTVTRVATYQARGELTGIAEHDPIFCRFIGAYITRMFELAGAKSVTCRHVRCVCRGDSSCVYEGGWRDVGATTAGPESR